MIIIPSKLSVDSAALMALGREVQRATATLPQTTTGNLYTISGGKVLLTHIYGEVTTAIQAQANNTKLTFDPTVTGSDVDLCAVLDITGKAVGTIFTITGTLATAMQAGLAVVGMAAPIVLQAGVIKLNCAASNTGSVKWVCRYLPIDAGARIVAA